jgi:hypothetical protein
MSWYKKARRLKDKIEELNTLLPKDKQVYWDSISSHQLKFKNTNEPVIGVNQVDDVLLVVLGMMIGAKI